MKTKADHFSKHSLHIAYCNSGDLISHSLTCKWQLQPVMFT